MVVVPIEFSGTSSTRVANLFHSRQNGSSSRFLLAVGETTDEWSGVVADIPLATVHLQDMYDRRGDKMRERKTAPLVISDMPAR